VTDGSTTKEHTATSLVIAGVDPEADIVSGTADAGAAINVNVNAPDGGRWRSVTADSEGNWSAIHERRRRAVLGAGLGHRAR